MSPWMSSTEPRQRTPSQSSHLAPGRALGALCVCIFVLAIVLVRPQAEIGIVDDWSIAHSALALAQTGRIQYNGWEAAILGWQLYPAAALIRLFGFSFAACRLTIELEACALVYLLHRCFVRCGVNARNATWGTLAVVLSPLFLPVATTFMTDVPGLLTLFGCFYCCLRALTSRRPALWLVAGAMLSAMGGTARQTSWLGFLVMVPAVLWVRRKQRPVLVAGALSFAVASAIVFASLRWFGHQPLAIKQSFLPTPSLRAPLFSAMTLSWLLLDSALLLLPLLFPFFGQLRAKTVASVSVAVIVAWVLLRRTVVLSRWTAPFLHGAGDYIGLYGIGGQPPPHGQALLLFHYPLRVLLTLLTILGATAAVRLASRAWRSQTTSAVEPAHALALPFLLAYLLLLIPRSYTNGLYDRYGLPLIFVGAILLVRLYQDNISPQLPRLTAFGIAVFALYGIAGTHDMFAEYRASLTDLRELQAAGIPRAQVDGGWEFNGWTQIEVAGYVHDPSLQTAQERSQAAKLRDNPQPCTMNQAELFPDVHPRYALALSPSFCDGAATFPAVTFRKWLPPFHEAIYVVRENDPARAGTP